MRFRNKNTGAIIDVNSEIKGPWEKIGGGAKPAAPISEPEKAEPVSSLDAEPVKKKPGRKSKK